MGKRMVERNQLPELIISSEANRAISTARLLNEQLNTKLITSDKLYHSSPDIIIEVIAETPNEVNSLAIVCHNPGVSQLNYLLTGHALDMVTCAICQIDLEIDTWKGLIPEIGNLAHFDYPKNVN